MTTPSAWKTYQPNEEKALRQGDLIIRNEAGSAVQAGIILTADCHLDRRKHARRVTVAQLCTPDSILTNYLFGDYLESRVDEALVALRKILGATNDLSEPEIRAKTLSYSGTQNEEVEALRTIVGRRIQCTPTKQLFIRLLASMSIDKTKAASSISNKIADKDDVLVLPPPPDTLSQFCICWLRDVQHVPLADIALTTSEADELPWVRAYHLESPHKYRLTQKFASVFSSIGTPDVDKSMLPNLITEALK